VVALHIAVGISTAASADLRQPQILHAGDIVRGRFVQERTLAGFSKPLKSEGTFVLIIGRGLIWHAKTPFESVTVIRPEGITVQSNGQETMRLTSEQVPGLSHLYAVLAGAASGDTSALRPDFAVKQDAPASGWQIHLTPLRAQTVGQLNSLTVAGHRFVETVTIGKGNGDTDRLEFSGQGLSSASPSADEEKLLGSSGR
jgi:hypothetical protein